MAREIERKWLVDPNDIPFDLSECRSLRIEQSYLSFYPQIRLRSVDDGTRYYLTVKPPRNAAAGEAAAGEAAAGGANGERTLARDEYEAEITAASYAELRPQTTGKTLLKRRYLVPAACDRVWEIDIYEGEFAGLAVAEMEFASEEEALAFEAPAWVGRDVSFDPTFKNVCMAQGEPL